MIAFIIRIRNDYVRVALLVLLFVPTMMDYIFCALLPARWGGHTNKRRLLEASFYAMGVDFFLAAMHGEFVGRARKR